ncbi:MAG: hypothetical protein NUW01_12880 [Gemmatimonadaceae bacterium]|nr:hypothetical protein [Gemmatimonadaceae bacterium]
MAARRTTQDALPAAGSAADLLGAKDAALDVEPFPVPEWGVTVKVRGLTRGEVKHIGKAEVTADEAEVHALTCGVVEPKLSEDDAKALLDGKGFGSTEALLNKILDKSGMTPGFREG